MNTDQGSQFIFLAWIDQLKRIGSRNSMHGKGRCVDNISIKRLWRPLNQECLHLQARETGSQAKVAVGRWISFYNFRRPHVAHGGQPPDVVYFNHAETDHGAQKVASIIPEIVQLSESSSAVGMHECHRDFSRQIPKIEIRFRIVDCRPTRIAPPKFFGSCRYGIDHATMRRSENAV